ncbi:MAG: hypothetical protein HY867_18410 [Chloroflexi bacterium]|nr:hypothetical protein [Chloroflexota bacterium]
MQSYQSASAATAFDLNNGDYYAYIEDKDRLQLMPTIKPVAISRGKYPPTIVGKVREMDKTKITIRIRAADWRTALKNLSAACANDEDELGTLTVTDENGAEWTIQANVENILRTGYQNVYEMPLNVPDLIWRKIATEDEWLITASEQTVVINNTGNRVIRPTFQFEATSIKADGFLYRHWLPIKNPSVNGYNYKSVDLTNGGVDSRDWVKDLSNYVQINNVGGINNSQTTIPYDTKTEGTPGSIGTYGMGYISDGVNVEQICWTDRTGTTSGNLTGVTRGIGTTSPHAFADNVKIYLSYCKADLSDVRYYRNGLEQNIWIDAPNTASTKIWVVATEPAGITMTLGSAIGSGGTLTEIAIANTIANRTAIDLLPDSGVVRINDEAFHFTDKDPIRLLLSTDNRSINETSPAAHAVGDTIYFVPNDGWLYMGNPFLEAQDTNDRREPMLDKTSSNNLTRVFTSFGDSTGVRADSWTPDVESSLFAESLKASSFYGGNHTANADPYTEMGMKLQSIYSGGTWKSETGRITWKFYEPGGIASVTQWIYERYKTSSSWPAYVRLMKSKDNKTWEDVATVVTPTAAGAWGSTTAGPYTIGTDYLYLMVIMWGTQSAGQTGGVGYQAAFEVNSLTYTVENPLEPEIMPRSLNSYEHNFRLLNQTTGEYFKVVYTGKLNGVIEVDCEAKTFTALGGKLQRSAIFVPNTQKDWMTFASGNNTLKLFETGVTGLTATVIHEDMLAV